MTSLEDHEAFLAKLRSSKCSTPLARKCLQDLERKAKAEIVKAKRNKLLRNRIGQRKKIAAKSGLFVPFTPRSSGDVSSAHASSPSSSSAPPSSSGTSHATLLNATCKLATLHRKLLNKDVVKICRFLTASASTADPRQSAMPDDTRILATCELINKHEKRISFDTYRRLHNVDGNLRIHADDIIYDHMSRKYRIIDLLGCGAYGQVLRARDSDNNDYALKVLNTKRQTNKDTEARLLKLVEHHGGSGRLYILKLEAAFLYRSAFPCLLFKQHGISLYDHIQANGALVMTDIVHVMKQVTLALREVHTLGHVHSDVKPENILLRYTPAELAAMQARNPAELNAEDANGVPKRLAVVLIDFGTSFGSSVNSNGWRIKYIQSRFYRAVEVFLECQKQAKSYIYDTPIDMWSLGCLAMELFLGQPLFQGRSGLEMITGITSLLGPLPADMIEMASSQELISIEDGTKKLKQASEAETKYLPSRRFRISKLMDFVGGHTVCPTCQPDFRCSLEKRRTFLHFVSKLFALNPSDRITAGQALRHPFLQDSLPEEVINELPEGHINESFRSFRLETFLRPQQPQKERPLFVELPYFVKKITSPRPKKPRHGLKYDFKSLLWANLIRIRKQAKAASSNGSSKSTQVAKQSKVTRRSGANDEAQVSEALAQARLSNASSTSSSVARPEQLSASSSQGSTYILADSSRPESRLSVRSNQSEQVLAKTTNDRHLPSQSQQAQRTGKGGYQGGNRHGGGLEANAGSGITPQARPHTQFVLVQQPQYGVVSNHPQPYSQQQMQPHAHHAHYQQPQQQPLPHAGAHRHQPRVYQQQQLYHQHHQAMSHMAFQQTRQQAGYVAGYGQTGTTAAFSQGYMPATSLYSGQNPVVYGDARVPGYPQSQQPQHQGHPAYSVPAGQQPHRMPATMSQTSGYTPVQTPTSGVYTTIPMAPSPTIPHIIAHPQVPHAPIHVVHQGAPSMYVPGHVQVAQNPHAMAHHAQQMQVLTLQQPQQQQQQVQPQMVHVYPAQQPLIFGNAQQTPNIAQGAHTFFEEL
eukprot:m.178069 g.178069  ORF g.178069 m.178069 type:complete len:1040 (-) comp16584_c0_seq2:125-3244(-)